MAENVKQLRRRLRDDPGVWSLLERALGEHPATSGRLTGLRPRRPARPSFSTWLTGTWHPDGTDVLVKVNTTRRERFWMSAASQGAPGSVPHVFASDDALGPVAASWLVLERHDDPAVGERNIDRLSGRVASQPISKILEIWIARSEDCGQPDNPPAGGIPAPQ